MRLWSIHPRYLDTKGLVALWRETLLLAQAVLFGNTKGAVTRGYKYNSNKIEKIKKLLQEKVLEIHSFFYLVEGEIEP